MSQSVRGASQIYKFSIAEKADREEGFVFTYANINSALKCMAPSEIITSLSFTQLAYSLRSGKGPFYIRATAEWQDYLSSKRCAPDLSSEYSLASR